MIFSRSPDKSPILKRAKHERANVSNFLGNLFASSQNGRIRVENFLFEKVMLQPGFSLGRKTYSRVGLGTASGEGPTKELS